MATLIKSQSQPVDDQLISLSSSIPAPFSSTDRAYILRAASQPSLPHRPITPTSLAPDLPPHTLQTQHLQATVPYTDEELLDPTQVRSLLGPHPCLLCDLD
jgi:hypothetical protein